jgi:hypothetical protein
MLNRTYHDAFDKKSIQGRQGNVFTRLDALEALPRQALFRDLTQQIISIIGDNDEMIVPLYPGGVSDPADSAFSGLVISRNGQTINGIAYSFAIVFNGVVFLGIGDDGTDVPVVIGGTATTLEDGQYSGNAEDGTAGDALAFGNLVYLSVDVKWKLVDASAAATCKNRLGMCVLAAAADGDVTKILTSGTIRADTLFPDMLTGCPMYASVTAGLIADAPPSANAGEIVRFIGYANTAHELSFNPSGDYYEVG